MSNTVSVCKDWRPLEGADADALMRGAHVILGVGHPSPTRNSTPITFSCRS